MRFAPSLGDILPGGAAVVTDLVGQFQHRADHRIVHRQVRHHIGDPDARLQCGHPRIEESLTCADQSLITLIDYGASQFFLGAEVKVQGALGHIRLRDDLRQTRVRVAQPQKDIGRAREHGIASDLRTRLPSHQIRLSSNQPS